MRLTPVSMGLKNTPLVGGSAVCASLRLIAVGGVSVAGPGRADSRRFDCDGPHFRSSAAISCFDATKGSEKSRLAFHRDPARQLHRRRLCRWHGPSRSDPLPAFTLLPDASTFIVLRGWVSWTRMDPARGRFSSDHRLAARRRARQGVFVMHAAERRDEIFQESGVMTLLFREDKGTRTNREIKTENTLRVSWAF